MTQRTRWIVRLLVAGACAVTLPGFAAQTYPDRAIRLIIPFPPGGTADTILRVLAQKLADAFAPQMVVDNRPGGGTIIATEIGARANADGYTLLAVSTAYTVNPSLYKKLPYDPDKSFAPVTLVAAAPNVLVVNPAVPVASVAELTAYAKSKPRQLNFGSAGNGTSTHLAGEMFKGMAKVDITHIPYKGDAPAITDLISGQTQILFIGWGPIEQHVKSGRVKALAVTSASPTPLVPNLPTVASGGLPNFVSSVWSGLMVPAGTPANVIARLQSEVAKILKQSETRDRIIGMGYEPIGSAPAEFGAFVRAETARWAMVIKEAGIRVE